jgi:hypothetical protein
MRGRTAVTGPAGPDAGATSTGSSRIRAGLRWLFASRATGRIVVAQWPNLPLWLFIGGEAARLVLHSPSWFVTALGVFAGLALAWWAVDEVLRGVNPWRRLLGLVVLGFLASSL